ncbi:hypothetical protein PENSOL_c011G09110 [Penicillium solitum]|uniref:Carrier domain-containing protein n=1 Tax=Penicillium solitum TaxID=60172 RepID=A0A1V6R8X8_9EURO|nr:uncharacterized protein PENSOL_c011G09110 [Penicillium solitum]OQD97777.1 hypothetical protein PENSOL_c011G09110 [Penicillium solitum]
MSAISANGVSQLHFIDDLITLRGGEKEQPDILACTSGTTIDRYEYFTAKRLDNLINNAAHGEEPRCVAVLGTSNLEYLTNICALSRLGYSVLIISPRLSVPAYNNLLDETKCSTLMYMQEYRKIVEQLCEVRQSQLATTPMLQRQDFDRDGIPEARIRRTAPNAALASPHTAFVMHSSGSTGVPKPIFHSHRRCLENFQNGFGLSALITLPLYHTYGFSSFFRAVHGRTLMYLYNWNVPLTSTNVIKTLQAANPQLLSTVPYTLGLLAESEEGINALKNCELVTYHGSACPDELGDRLVRQGIFLVGHLGSTESGPLATSNRAPEDTSWSYLRFLPCVKPYVWMKPIDDNAYELVLLKGLKAKIFSNSDTPPESFHSRDLFEPHPTIPNAWKYIGRLDDRVTLLNGEKVLPLPIEGLIRESPLVKEAVVFGIGRAVPGIMIFRNHGLDMTDDEFLDSVWLVIQKANKRAEGFSQIGKDMIIVLSPEKSYPRTDKGSVIRAQTYNVFSGLIDDVYQRRDNIEEGDLTLEIPETANLILGFCNSTLELSVDSVQSDLFASGLDSLKAIQLSVFIRKNFNLGGNGPSIGQNVIYDHGSVNRLAKLVYHSRVGANLEAVDDNSTINAWVEKYSQFENPTSPAANMPKSSRHRIILTGVTGSLGAHILAKLAQSSHVEIVYCPVRKLDDVDAMSRVIQSLRQRKLSLDQDSSAKVIALYSDIGKNDFGLETTIFGIMKKTVSLIIHAAWSVNFNLGLSSFEDQIKGLSNLIQFSLDVEQSKPARFLFCSSISVASRAPVTTDVAESLITDYNHASRTGYARSKLISELIIGKAAQMGARSSILRIGQIVGDSVHGIWTNMEAIPLIIQSARAIDVLPQLDETCAWIPVDYLAETIAELSLTTNQMHFADDSNLPLVYNIVNPTEFHWTRDMLPAMKEAGVEFTLIPPSEWVKRLEKGDTDPSKNPAIKLLSFFQYRYGGNTTHEYRQPRFETTQTQRDSPSLGKIPNIISAGLMNKFIAVWDEK